MRISKVLSGAAVALALTAASGCYQPCEYVYPAGTEAQTQYVVTRVVAAPAPAVERQVVLVVEQPKVVAQPAPVEKQVVLVNRRRPHRHWNWSGCRFADEEQTVEVQTVAAQPVAVQPVEVKAEPKVLVVEPARREVAGQTVMVLRRGRKGKILTALNNNRIIRVVETSAPVTTTTTVVSEPAVVVPAAEPTAAIVAEEPSWTQYLAPEQPAVVSEPAIVSETAPVSAAQFVPAAPITLPAGYAGRQPIVIQPIIQPVVQTGQEVLSGAVQMPAMPAMTAGLPVYATTPAQLMTPPQFTLASDPTVCGPGQNCFTLPENQLATGPQILTPNAAAPLSFQTETTVASAAPATLALPPTVVQDKYNALPAAPAAPEAVLPTARPEVSMPAPLTTTPPVAGTAEIESALEVMLGTATTPVLK